MLGGQVLLNALCGCSDDLIRLFVQLCFFSFFMLLLRFPLEISPVHSLPSALSD